MDAGIADAVNRRTVRSIVEHLDVMDIDLCATEDGPWYSVSLADTLLGTNDATDADRAWLVGILAATTPGITFDGPADEDWENFYSYMRAEILARRDPKSPHAATVETPRRVVV